MKKIIDCFLFYAELDLLEIRLNFLYKHVDKFIILESSQTFSGKKKEFIFEKNKKRFQKFIDKIHYFKLEENFNSYDEIVQNLNLKSNDNIKRKIFEIMESHNHYSKKELNWVLDSYQRESMHIPMSTICNDNDLIIFSDIDEIPSLEIIKNCKSNNYSDLVTAKQHHFNIYLNCYQDSKWIGSIIGDYKYFKNKSLNILRMISKIDSGEIHHLSIMGGYHFSWIGDSKTIINKLKFGSHQEFNFKFLRYLVQNDIFNFLLVFSIYEKKNFQILSLNENIIYEPELLNILIRYKNLLYERSFSNAISFRKYLIKLLFKTLYFNNRIINFFKNL